MKEKKRKEFRGRLKLLDGGAPGEFEATFATLNVIDLDGEVTLTGAFTEDQAVRIAAWGHNWGTLPVGRGAIHEDDEKAIVRGRFFLQTAAGREHYETVKALGELQEWSYGFHVLDWEEGEFEGKDVIFLKEMEVYEVSPVMLGAGIGTETTDIKALRDVLEGEGKAEALQELHDLLISLGAKCAERHHESEGDEEESGKSGDATPRTAKSSTLAARVAMELLDFDNYSGIDSRI